MSIGKGIAIGFIWLAPAACAFSHSIDTGLVAMFGMIATIVIVRN